MGFVAAIAGLPLVFSSPAEAVLKVWTLGPNAICHHRNWCVGVWAACANPKLML